MVVNNIVNMPRTKRCVTIRLQECHAVYFFTASINPNEAMWSLNKNSSENPSSQLYVHLNPHFGREVRFSFFEIC